MEYRILKSIGKCSICNKKIGREEESVIIHRSYKHKKLVTICNNCIENIYKLKEKNDRS